MRIGGSRVEMHVVNCVRSPDTGEHDSDADGTYFPRHREIQVVGSDGDRPCSADEVGERKCHEILHMLIDQSGFSAGWLSDDREEKLVTALAPRLFDLLRQNPVEIADIIAGRKHEVEE